MAILTRKSQNETPTISYAGMVVRKIVRDERVMSDVWAYCTYAVVYDIIQDREQEILFPVILMVVTLLPRLMPLLN